MVVWRDQAEHAAQSLSKGSPVVVVGRLQQRSWTAEDSSARSVVEVVAEELGSSLRWAATTTRTTRSQEPTRPMQRAGVVTGSRPRSVVSCAGVCPDQPQFSRGGDRGGSGPHPQALMLLAQLLSQLGRELVEQHPLQLLPRVEAPLAGHPDRREALSPPEPLDAVWIGPATPRRAGQPGRKGAASPVVVNNERRPPGWMTRASSASPGSQPGPKKYLLEVQVALDVG